VGGQQADEQPGVKKMRQRCSTMAARNTSAAQWWTWRISSPVRTSKLSRTVEA
jgi:hypothetical protein